MALDKERLAEIGVDLEPNNDDEITISYAKLMYYLSVFLLVVVAPPIIYLSYMNMSRTVRMDREWNEFIINATKNYLSKNTIIRDSVEEGNIDRIYLSVLMDQGFLPEKLVNPVNGNTIEFCNYVLISSNFNYTVSSANECIATEEKPVIRLNGASTVRIPVGGNFTELGAEVIDARGRDITDRLEINGVVDEVRAGVYRIVYTAVDHNGRAADPVYRTVVVGRELSAINQDRVPPMLFIGEPIYANQQVEVPIIAMDNIALKTIRYKIDENGEWQTENVSGTKQQIKITDRDNVCRTLFAYAIDTSGNRSRTIEQEFGNCDQVVETNDTTPPVINIHGVPDGWVQGPVTITIMASDNTQLNTIFYKYRSFAAYSSRSFLSRNVRDGSVQITLREPGIYTISAYANDAAGNFSNLHSVTVRVGTPPRLNR